MATTRRLFGVLAVALAIALAGCGGDSGTGAGSDSRVPAPSTSEAPSTSAPSTTTTAATVTEAPLPGASAAVSQGNTVSVHYVGTLDDGEQFDSSRDRGQPLTFVVGAGQMISGFDTAVQGMELGEIKAVRLLPAEAYGERSDDLVVEVGLDQVPPDTSIGDTLIAQDGRSVMVLAVEGDVVTIDANHPLAGEVLTFEIEIVDIQP